jgi:phosphate transport system substrate-binding protein
MRSRSFACRLKAASALAGAAWLAGLCACSVRGVPQPREIRIAGSDTMLLLTRRWAEEFMRREPGLVVSVRGGGTGSGVEDLVRGDVELCAASRPLFPDEVQQLYERHRTLGVSFRCARDALGVYVHPDNPVRNLSLDELTGIFTGRITTWQALGGLEAPIEVLVRQPNSGTYRLFQELVLSEEPFYASAATQPTTAAVVASVLADRSAIGYGGLAYGAGVALCRIDGVEPTPRNVRNGDYALARYLYLYTVRPPKGWTRRFVDWVLSSEGQRLVDEVGYVPLFADVAAMAE